jgi:hypothetical protein
LQRAENEFFKESPKASVNMTTLESIDSVQGGLVAESMEALALYEHRLRSRREKANPGSVKCPSHFTPAFMAKALGKNCPVCNQPGHKVVDCKGFRLKSARERYTVVKGFGICFHCLLGSHLIRDCKHETSKTCGKEGCDKHHHQLLHRDDTVGGTFFDSTQTNIEDPINNDSNHVVNHIITTGGTSVNLLVCSINAHDRLKHYPVITMLDMGANSTFIDEDLALDLKLPIISTQNKTLNYLDTKASIISNEVQFQLVSQTDLYIISLRGWTIKDLAIRTGCIDWYTQKDQYDYLKNLPIPSLPKSGRVSIIIGTNYPGLFKQLDQVHQPILNSPWQSSIS